AEASTHLQVVLVGQPSLTAVLRRPENRAPQPRARVGGALEPLPPEELGDYISHRLSIAGGTRLEFDAAALAHIHRLSLGSPRGGNLPGDGELGRGFGASSGCYAA